MKQRLRHELKYLVSLPEAKAFLGKLTPYCRLDSFTQSNGSYEVASLYYDTQDLRFFWDREESVGYRRKVRLRSYNGGGCSLNLSLEIKEKHKHLVGKKRHLFPEATLLEGFSPHSQIPLDAVISALPEIRPESREAIYLHSRLGLHPQIIIRYIRTALIAKYEHDLRITLDSRITAGGEDLIRYEPLRESFLIQPDKAILEIKSNANIPIWLQTFLSESAFRQGRFSKYCLGMSTLYRSKLLPSKPISNFETDTLDKVA